MAAFEFMNAPYLWPGLVYEQRLVVAWVRKVYDRAGLKHKPS